MSAGWKLAAVVQFRADATLLDTYHDERHPWALDVAEHTLAQTALITATTPTGQALRRLLSTLIGDLPDLSLTLARRLAGLDVRYAPGPHPLTGTRVATTGNALLDGHPAVSGAAAPRDRYQFDPLPVDAAAALIRPDGYIWWATDDATAPTLPDVGVRFDPR